MIVGELTHDHKIFWNVEYESLWDNLGMSDIIVILCVGESGLYFLAIDGQWRS